MSRLHKSHTCLVPPSVPPGPPFFVTFMFCVLLDLVVLEALVMLRSSRGRTTAGRESTWITSDGSGQSGRLSASTTAEEAAENWRVRQISEGGLQNTNIRCTHMWNRS